MMNDELEQDEIKNHLIVPSKYVKLLAIHSPPNDKVCKLKGDLGMMMIMVKLEQFKAKKAINNTNKAVKMTWKQKSSLFLKW
jgi:hypothetical protein